LASRTPRSECAPNGSNRVLSPIAGEHGGDKDSTAQELAQCLYARNLVDRGPDDGKVEAIDSADIAIEHLAKMEGEIDSGNRLGRHEAGQRRPGPRLTPRPRGRLNLAREAFDRIPKAEPASQ
jgi:hypothetical protein